MHTIAYPENIKYVVTSNNDSISIPNILHVVTSQHIFYCGQTVVDIFDSVEEVFSKYPNLSAEFAGRVFSYN